MKYLIFGWCIVNFAITAFGQGQSAPFIEWQRVTSPWRNHPKPFNTDGSQKPIRSDNRNSGDDWWYDHTKSYGSNGYQDGVVCAGYYTWKNQGYHESGEGVLQEDLPFYYNVEDFETGGHQKGTMWASIMKFDNDGRNGFCRSYYTNEYNAVTSLNDQSGFIAVGLTSSSLHPEVHHKVYNTSSMVVPKSPIVYNPINSSSGNHFAHRSQYSAFDLKHRRGKGLVTKIDNHGNIIWSYLYGPKDYDQGGFQLGNSTLVDYAHIWNVAEDPSTGNLWVIGIAQDRDYNNLDPVPEGFDDFTEFGMSRQRLKAVSTDGDQICNNDWRPFLMCLDANGMVLAKDYIDTDGRYGIAEGLGIAINNGMVYVSGAYQYECYVQGNHQVNNNSVSAPYVVCYSTDLNANPSNPFNRIWARFHEHFGEGEDHGRTTSILVNSEGNVVLPVIHSSGNSNPAGPTAASVKGYGIIYLFDGETGEQVVVNGQTIPYEQIELDEELKAYDLKFDLIQTSDQGYALSSTVKHVSDITNIHEISNLLDNNPNYTDHHSNGEEHTQYEHYYSNLEAYTWFWDTDAYAAKFDADFNLEWEKVIPYGGNTREAYPGNAKRQECVYAITENEDGSFTISGNTSDNFDDCYLINLQFPCQELVDIDYDFAGEDNGYTYISTFEQTDGPSSDYVWHLTGNHTINGAILVDEHTTLHLEDAHLQFTDHKYDNKFTGIFVDAGGKLIVDHSTITGLEDAEGCKARWDGIYVEGNTEDNQFDTEVEYGQTYRKQGQAIISNSTIKNARRAALNNYGIYYATNQKVNWGKSGGIIQVKNTDFINNRRSVSFLAYQNTKMINGEVQNYKDKSYFNNCHFKTNSDYPSLYPNILQSQVTLWKVQGVDFKGCTFENETTQQLLPIEKGMGIYSIDATYAVSEYTPFPIINPIRGEFKGYANGIHVQNSMASYTNHIAYQDFEDNTQDITLEFVNGPEIKNNTFVQLAKQGHKSIFLKGTGNYDIRENTLLGGIETSSLSNSPLSIFYESDCGILIDNFGFRNLGNIKDNTIDGYTYATMFTNGTLKESTALLRCNAYGFEKDNVCAIALDDDGFINPDHEYINSFGVTVPVANTFSHFDPEWQNFSDINNRNNDFYLKYFCLEEFEHDIENGLYTSWNVDVNTTYLFNEDQCECSQDRRLDKFNVTNKTTMHVTLNNLYSNWQTINDNLQALRDGGDKEFLLYQIQNPTTESAFLRNELVEKSPYLSDDVLLEVINRSVPLQPIHLADVLVANTPLNRKVKQELFLNPPFGNPLFDIVLLPEGRGVLKLLELQVRHAKQQLDEGIQFALSESTNKDLDYTTHDVWKLIHSIDSRDKYIEERIDLMVQQDYFQEALDMINGFEGNSTQYLSWINFNQQLEGRNYLQLDPLELETIKEWSKSSNSYLKSKGQALLNLQSFDQINTDQYVFGDYSPLLLPKLEYPEATESHWVSVSENPVQDVFYLVNKGEETTFNFTITNAKGIVIYQGECQNEMTLIPSKEWLSGVYFIHVIHPTLGEDVIKIIKNE